MNYEIAQDGRSHNNVWVCWSHVNPSDCVWGMLPMKPLQGGARISCIWTAAHCGLTARTEKKKDRQPPPFLAARHFCHLSYNLNHQLLRNSAPNKVVLKTQHFVICDQLYQIQQLTSWVDLNTSLQRSQIGMRLNWSSHAPNSANKSNTFT